ncbi:MAG: enoyl-CoA hydratase/isomerase family protein [Hyphomonadaceae bacterium]|nr:enoyl-CoA hydratase/isomerase family protein [Hyphomonadaceae bacterium]
MDFTDIKLSVQGRLGIVSIARAEQNNAVRPQTLREICQAFDQLAADDSVRAIILEAEGKHFCAGADFVFLRDLTEMSPAAVKNQIYTHFQGAARRIYHCEKPTIALVSGAAVTVGCELALACDFRVAAENARFQESWIRLGLMPPLGGLFLLPRIVGLGRAAQMVLRGEAMDAASALQAGLVTEVVSPETLHARGRELAEELAALPPLAYGAVKSALHRGMETSMDAEWSANVTAQAVLLSTGDFREGLAAISERRSASFQGS